MLQFAIVGCGRIAIKHAELLASGLIPNARLTAVCDIIPERAAQFGKKFSVPYFTDFHEMMLKMPTGIDVVNILTPSGLHASHCFELVPYKKHLVIEKPMALTLADADQMISACDRVGVRLFVVKQNRYNLPVKKLREAIEQNRFGKNVLGTIRVRWCRKQEYYDQDSWRGKWAFDGGVLANQASHHIDLLEWMMGPVESIFAKATTRLVKIECEDTAVAVLKFRSGALGVIEATTATRPTDLEGSISILGEKGTVEIGGFALNEMKTWRFTNETAEDKEILQNFKTNPPNVYGYGHQEYLAHVVDCIENKREALVAGLEGRKSLELISAIYESIETGKEVYLRFQPKLCRLGMSERAELNELVSW